VNPTIENMQRIVQTGDVESMMGGNSISSGAAELRATKEMQAEGMQTASLPEGKTFSDVLRKSVETVNQDQVQANTAIDELVAGRTKNIHETMLTIERADTSLKMMMQVRNKILDAYREIMRMQV
jgi:flagellar hook-basal body complex protein FliE